MNRLRQARWCLAICAAVQLAAFPLFAGNPPKPPDPVKSFSAPRTNSPVDLFRQLLAMTPDERENFLTNKPPEIRARILAKVAEYESLDPDERELRLRATELRWYLLPLLREPPEDRAAQLARVPDNLRELIQNRLEEWTILPPSLQQEFLEMDVSNNPAENSARGQSDVESAHWKSLSEAERRQITDGFNQFFELTPDEKQKTLNTLSDAERAQMEKTLQSFEKLPSAQRAECVSAFAKFASMDARQQAEFLKNAARWSEMSPAERQAWRDLVVNVPQWPPLPSGFVVPIPGESNPAVVTNHN
jgi:hypothetical protein